MKKTAVFFLSLLLFCGNFFIFFYGISREMLSRAYLEKIRSACMLTSALVLSLHDYEDSGMKPELDGNSMLGNDSLSWDIKEIDKGNIYIKVKVRHGKKTYTADYITKK